MFYNTSIEQEKFSHFLPLFFFFFIHLGCQSSPSPSIPASPQHKSVVNSTPPDSTSLELRLKEGQVKGDSGAASFHSKSTSIK